MDFPPETIILIVAVLVVAAVAYLQLRYIRSKKLDKLEGAMEQDDAFNAVATTKAVASSLRQTGRDTTEADLLIYQAESAYERREFTNCLDLAKRAKAALHNSKEKDLLTCPVPPTAKAGEDEAKEVPANEAKKLPANYLESKFVIDSVGCMLPDAPEDRRAEARAPYELAKESFERADYTEALKQAMKAKRALASPAKAERPRVVAAGIAPKPAPVKRDACGKCGADLGPEDEFCHACGGKKGGRSCPTCSKEASAEDVFCRKCGAKIGH